MKPVHQIAAVIVAAILVAYAIVYAATTTGVVVENEAADWAEANGYDAERITCVDLDSKSVTCTVLTGDAAIELTCDKLLSVQGGCVLESKD